jgi:hypothetical protein
MAQVQNEIRLPVMSIETLPLTESGLSCGASLDKAVIARDTSLKPGGIGNGFRLENNAPILSFSTLPGLLFGHRAVYGNTRTT